MGFRRGLLGIELELCGSLRCQLLARQVWRSVQDISRCKTLLTAHCHQLEASDSHGPAQSSDGALGMVGLRHLHSDCKLHEHRGHRSANYHAQHRSSHIYATSWLRFGLQYSCRQCGGRWEVIACAEVLSHVLGSSSFDNSDPVCDLAHSKRNDY